MIIENTNYWNTPVRSFSARVELYFGSALADAYTAYYGLKSFKIERVGDGGKFFGYGICQKINLKLIDKDRAINITTDHSLKAYLSTGGTLITPAPQFFVSETHRDETTNELSITAYDALYGAAANTKVADLELQAPYTMLDFADACAKALGCVLGSVSAVINKSAFNQEYAAGANFDGSESLRTALNAIAEATQTIYYINGNNQLIFKSLDMSGEPVLTITKEDYITLESKDSRRLSRIVHATELGDDVFSALEISGSTQYIRDNPFWVMRDDLASMLESAINAVGGLTITQFSCDWRGNFALEIGDKIGLVTKDNELIKSYVLDDVITYSGGLDEVTKWSYTDNENETAAAPISLGELLNKTTATVDKVNQEITLQIIKTESLNNKVDSTQAELSSYKQTSNEALISFQTAIEEEGVRKIVTETGFKFDAEGLTVSKADTDITTTITEDGMKVNRGEDVVLTVDNHGVQAEDLHATTYLIIGDNSRLENYNNNRTGCFWIGG